MPALRTFSDEQSRLLVNLRMHYEAWIEVERAIAGLLYDPRRKTINGRSYPHMTNGPALPRLSAASVTSWRTRKAYRGRLLWRASSAITWFNPLWVSFVCIERH
jgi:hypothetical protein